MLGIKWGVIKVCERESERERAQNERQTEKQLHGANRAMCGRNANIYKLLLYVASSYKHVNTTSHY